MLMNELLGLGCRSVITYDRLIPICVRFNLQHSVFRQSYFFPRELSCDICDLNIFNVVVCRMTTKSSSCFMDIRKLRRKCKSSHRNYFKWFLQKCFDFFFGMWNNKNKQQFTEMCEEVNKLWGAWVVIHWRTKSGTTSALHNQLTFESNDSFIRKSSCMFNTLSIDGDASTTRA